MRAFVIITPAHNEEEFIANTIESMLSQTMRPLRWVIVNDGSIDGTRTVVERFLTHSFIRLVNIERREGRHFGMKAEAFRRGLLELNDISYDYIGNLDADISLRPDYFESILNEFERDRSLGLAGGIVYTKMGETFVTQDKTLDSVGGAVQLFRRSCFEQVGGYISLEFGGIDAAAEITARMKGWRVRKFLNCRVYEHRRTGTASAHPFAARVKEGRRFHSLGYGVLFYFLRCLYRAKDRPLFLGSAAAFYGFLESIFRGRPIVLPREVVQYLREEQRQKLRAILGIAKQCHTRRPGAKPYYDSTAPLI
ncbi:MAG TPA: glycosyltransferase family A protein [Terrimicrobiaceae bacterium]